MEKAFGSDYLLDELWSDTGSGHNVVQTFMNAEHLSARDGYLRPLAKTRYISELASTSAATADRALLPASSGM